MNKLAYLDLQIKINNKKSITLKESEHSCYFDKNYEHELHGENKQSNSIIDLLINLGFAKELLENKYKEIIIPSQKMLRDVIQNQQYNKNQLTSILNKLQRLEQSQADKPSTYDHEIKCQIQKIENSLQDITPIVKETKRIVLG